MDIELEDQDVAMLARCLEKCREDSFVNPLCWNASDELPTSTIQEGPERNRRRDRIPSCIVKKKPKNKKNGVVLGKDEEGETLYGIERFCGRKNDGNGNIHYLIKWENWSGRCTWQKSEDLTNAALVEVESLKPAPCKKCDETHSMEHVCWEDDAYSYESTSISSTSISPFAGFLSDDESQTANVSLSLTEDNPPAILPGNKKHKRKNIKKRKVPTKKSSTVKLAHKTSRQKESAEKTKVRWGVQGGPFAGEEYDYCIEMKQKSYDTLAKVLFPDRIFECKISSTQTIDTTLPCKHVFFRGHALELLCVRPPKRSPKRSKSSAPNYKSDRGEHEASTAYYVTVSGPKTTEISLERELEKLADFASLTARKAASRLELLFSDSKRLNRKYQKYWIINVSPSHFETKFNEDSCPLTLGCGFISSELIDKWYGGSRQGRKYHAFQVRIVAPKFGLFKGMLMEHPTIEGVYLPDSMKKVGASKQDDLKQHATINFMKVFPSKECHELQTSWGGKKGKIAENKPISEGVRFYLEEVLRVKKMTLSNYNSIVSHDKREQRHANLVGCADPTNEIPEKMVFLTGFNHIPNLNTKGVFITRNPCVSKEDGRRILVLQEKPPQMSTANWEFLIQLPFGLVLFPNSKVAELPPLIAGGDLDGDLYFVCWDESILSEVDCVPLSNKKPISKKKVEEPPGGGSWLQCAQRLQADTKTKTAVSKLTSNLHSEWKKDPSSDKGQAFAEAYKSSLDVPKHGGKVQLSKIYWSDVDSKLHNHLEDTA